MARPEAGWFQAAYRALQRVNHAMVMVGCATIVAITLLTLWGIFTRYFLRFPAMWTYPIIAYLLLVLIFLSAAYVLQKDGHVRIDAVLDILQPRARQRVEQVQHLLSLVFLSVFFWICTQRAGRIFERWERDSSTLNIPIIIPAAVMAAGMALMVLTELFRTIEIWRNPESAPTQRDLSKLTVD
jgi:TRAP-type C4-dicarboxylate transport system permease small subunit